jgi:hypothetical protein
MHWHHRTGTSRTDLSRRVGNHRFRREGWGRPTGAGPVVAVELRRPTAGLAGTSRPAASRRDRRESETPRIAWSFAPGAMRGVCHCQHPQASPAPAGHLGETDPGGCGELAARSPAAAERVAEERVAGVRREGSRGAVCRRGEVGEQRGGTRFPATQWRALMRWQGVACDVFHPLLYWRFVCSWPCGSSERRACGST